MMKVITILTIALLLGAGVSAQSFSLRPVSLFRPPNKKQAMQSPVARPYTPINILAGNTFYKKDMGFFCKQEWNWQKHTGVPVKIRLGDYQYAQKQEGKR